MSKAAGVQPGKVEIQIRPAAVADLKVIVAVERSCFDDPWPTGDFKRLLDYPACLITIAELLDHSICGFSVSHYEAGDAQLFNLAVLPQFRKQGCAQLLVESVIRAAVIQECCRLHLEVRRSNLAAIALYEKMKFQEMNVIQKYYANGEEALTMMLQLPTRLENGDEKCI
ncbi:MAG: ribosomal protein S18-alanine N-acetyltransferase [Pirellulales bacterium]|nr:ribosomal protein S18-alanine N-acetyltransferase [Pirellulales bacterium]